MAPKLISDADFNRKLNAPERNREHTLAFLARGVEPLTLPGYVRPEVHQQRLLVISKVNVKPLNPPE